MKSWQKASFLDAELNADSRIRIKDTWTFSERKEMSADATEIVSEHGDMG